MKAKPSVESETGFKKESEGGEPSSKGRAEGERETEQSEVSNYEYLRVETLKTSVIRKRSLLD